MSNIIAVDAIEILDSRGNPTIQAEVLLSSGVGAAFQVPSGASCGQKEAVELRDHDNHRYLGKGVTQAVNNIKNKIQPALLNKSSHNQTAIDQILIQLDGTKNKDNLGANAILAVSSAVARAAAKDLGLELYEYLNIIFANKTVPLCSYQIPMPLINIINGGVHANNNLNVQEFMISPAGFSSFQEALRGSVEVFNALKAILKQNQFSVTTGDEGGFAPNLDSHELAMDYILSAIEQAGLIAGKDMFLALDIAANELFSAEHYYIENKPLSISQFVEKITKWVNNYPISSIEDPCAEEDFIGWRIITSNIGHKIQLVGDDLFVTNPQIFESILQENPLKGKIANAILIKPNQVGTLSETFTTINLARNYNYNYIISHRSGDTEDSFIADLAVAVNSPQIKAGSVCRSERLAKYNRLLNIERIVGNKS
jgi:enolase